MTGRSDFTAEEWQALVEAPAEAGLFVSAANRTGTIQLLEELVALAKAVRDEDATFADSRLVHAVIEHNDRRPNAPAPAAEAPPAAEERAELLATVTAANAALARAPQAEADAYRRWLLDIGRRVAEAAREGGFLGLGGHRVGPEEEDALRELAAALGQQP